MYIITCILFHPTHADGTWHAENEANFHFKQIPFETDSYVNFLESE